MFDLDLAGLLLESLKLIAAAVTGGLIGAARARRKAYHSAQFNEEEAAAYEAARTAFIDIRRWAAYEPVRHYGPDGTQTHLPPQGPEDEQRRAEAQQRGLQHLREVDLLGPIDLSQPAIDVIHQYLAAIDSDDRSDADSWYDEEDFFSERYLRDFTERRRVDLGQVSATWWRFGRWRREMTRRFTRWGDIQKNRLRSKALARRRGQPKVPKAR